MSIFHLVMLRAFLIFKILHITYGYENIALKKPSYETHEFSFSNYRRDTFDSRNAVDGLKSDLSVFGGQCAISADGYKDATWWVNLTSIHSIHDIRIYYRTDNNNWGSSNGFTSRFLGFYVYISNTTDRLDGHLCFHDTNYSTKTIPAVVDINCTVHGQYVIYYNERPQNSPFSSQYSPDAHVELCEVEVNGCNNTGYYGGNCSLPCPKNCQNGYCHIETGVCLSCSPGYHGHHCKLQCDGGRYGEGCGQKCGACLGYKQCNHVNGSCLEGCDFGFEGELCKSGCSDGRFGINCEHKCNVNCGVPNQCNRATGKCEGGCQPGWEGPRCDDVCNENKFGENCIHSCGFCRFSTCQNVNGSCEEGCKEGYKGTFCKEVCDAGFYGDDCKQECSIFCKTSRDCHHVTGHCNKGCIGGWQGFTCMQEKTDGSRFYGVLAALLICIVIIVVLVTYICIKRAQREKRKKQDRNKCEESRPTTVNQLYLVHQDTTNGDGHAYNKLQGVDLKKISSSMDKNDSRNYLQLDDMTASGYTLPRPELTNE